MSVRIEVRVSVGHEVSEHVFATLPVRLGREESCEVVLPYPFVSRVHARIEARGDEIVLIDEGGVNGLVHDGTRLRPHTPLRVGYHETFLLIHDVSLAVRVSDATEPVGGVDSTQPLPVLEEEGVRTSLYSELHLEPTALDAAQQAVESYRLARREALDALRFAVEGSPEERRSALMLQLSLSFAELAHDPELRALAYEHDVDLPAAPTEVDFDFRVPGPPAPDLEDFASRHVPHAGMITGLSDSSRTLWLWQLHCERRRREAQASTDAATERGPLPLLPAVATAEE